MVVASAQAARQPEPPIVVAQGLSKTFRDFWMRSRVRAVDHLDFEIRPREVFGLLGPNGSGKSTTIKLILGLLHKTSGRLSVFGKPPSDIAIKRRIGVLPEESYLYPFLNARETLDYYGRLFGLDSAARRRRIDELLEMVGLAAVQHRQIHEYSKGMRRRIGIAQALINDPEFLILDEPTTGLDPIGTRQVKDLIIDLGKRGKTVLLSSHQLSDVEDVVDRMVILYGGKKRAEGTVDELLTARSRMTLETDALDDSIIEEIDQVIHRRTGGAIRRVSRPRQRLEELFMGIVERAQAERVETFGAGAGGRTAAFLLGEEAREAPRGVELIDSLLASPDVAPIEAAAPAPSGPETGADVSVIGDLVDTEPAPEPAPPPPPRTERPRAKPAPDVDLGVIGSLLDDPGAPPNDGKSP